MPELRNRGGCRVKFEAYCVCGGAMTGEVEPPTFGFESAFWHVHKGEGHGVATKEEARNARRRADRRERQELQRRGTQRPR